MRRIVEMSLFVYKRDLIEILVFIVLGIIFWMVTGVLLSKRIRTTPIWTTINEVVFILAFFIIIYLTILSRNMNGKCELCLIPFYSFYLAKENTEFYRTMLMNVFLFVPLGLSLPNTFWGQKCGARGSVLAIIIFSVMIELLQFVLRLGRVEVDDVLCNTLGGMLGIGAYVFTKRILAVMKNEDKTPYENAE